MCRLQNIAMRDYQESVTTRQTNRHTDRQTDAGQSDPYVPLCFTGDTKNDEKPKMAWTTSSVAMGSSGDQVCSECTCIRHRNDYLFS